LFDILSLADNSAVDNLTVGEMWAVVTSLTTGDRLSSTSGGPVPAWTDM
jgi:hypothetical protein